MNLMQDPPRFQVDTGPLILPDFSAVVAHKIECFALAHVVYHGLDKAEFILRMPIPNDSPAAITDYSVVQIIPAQHEILASK